MFCNTRAAAYDYRWRDVGYVTGPQEARPRGELSAGLVLSQPNRDRLCRSLLQLDLVGYAASMDAAHFSAIMIEGALVLPDINSGMMDASTTRSF